MPAAEAQPTTHIPDREATNDGSPTATSAPVPHIDHKARLDADLQRAQGLERDLLTELLSSRRRAWQVATASFVYGIGATVALATIFPLKEPPQMVPIVVNENAVSIEHAVQLGNGKEDYGERLARFFIQQYVLACEAYDWNTIQLTHDTCGLFSAPSVQRAYLAKFQGDDSLLKRFSKHTRVRVNVRSITLGSREAATVRFTTTTDSDNGTSSSQDLVATLGYRYVNAPITESASRINPLGFQVTSYMTDVELAR